MKRTSTPIFCYVTDRRSLDVTAGTRRENALLERIRSAVNAGIDWVQLREKDLNGRSLLELSRAAVGASRGPGKANARTRVSINDRLDVAWAAIADGVHLGEASVPVRDAAQARRRLGGAEFQLGASCHSTEAARRAAQDGADYIFFGPVFATPSKAAFGAPQGVQQLANVCAAVRIPVLAIGGVTEESCAECLAAGAAGVAGIRLFQKAPDLGARLARMRETIR